MTDKRQDFTKCYKKLHDLYDTTVIQELELNN